MCPVAFRQQPLQVTRDFHIARQALQLSILMAKLGGATDNTVILAQAANVRFVTTN
jgi:hypothetical protein